MIQFTCPCGRKLQARDENVGREVECPACGRRQVVPGSEAVQVEPDLGPTAVRRERPAVRGEDEYPTPGPDYREPESTSGKAIAALILGIASVLLSFVGMIPAIILAILAQRDVRESRGRVGGAGMATTGLVLGVVLGLLSTIGWGVFFLVFSAVGQVREAAGRVQSSNNLKQIALAMQNYSDTYQTMPTAAIYSPNGQPLLSWRVAILPFIEQQALYNQFKLDEPWDGPNNSRLLALMPRVYKFPKEIGLPPDHTIYRVFEGPMAAFEGRKKLRFPFDFPDGTSNTILVVEADQGVPWTKPDELPFNPNQPVTPIQGHWASTFQAALADGSVRMIDRKLSAQTLRSAITRNGGEILGPDW
jgi:hypothetical protein